MDTSPYLCRPLRTLEQARADLERRKALSRKANPCRAAPAEPEPAEPEEE